MADGVRRKETYHRDVKINSNDMSLTFLSNCCVSDTVLSGFLLCLMGYAAKHTGVRSEA